MVLIKEIELALKPQSTEVQAQEDEILADSVLELANTDFSKADDYEDVTPGSIRKHVEADMRLAYPGKPTSRKKIFKGNFKEVDSKAKEEVSGDSDDKRENLIKDKGVFETDDSSEAEDRNESEEENVDIGDEDLESGDEDLDTGDEDAVSDESEEDIDEEELNSDFDGSILGGESGIKSGSEADEDDKQETVDTKGIDIFSQRARDIESDIEKGKSIRNQLTIWEKLIECRIKLQPGLINVNKLYQPDTFQEFKTRLDSEDEEVIKQTYTALSNLMKGLLELQENLLNAAPEFREMKATKRKSLDTDGSEPDGGQQGSKKKKMTGKDLLQEIHEEFKPFRNAAIQKWNEKTRVSSGKISKNDFSSFDLPTLKQIEEILLDRDRLLRRTRTKRSDYKILGKAENITVEDETSENSKRKNQGEYDPEIFDDDDFYHKLLRDFIEKKTSDVTDVSKRGKQWLELQKLRSKMKAKIDTRASKGRKLRFTVHNKMVNFMAPIPSFTWVDEARNELFKSLFC